MASKTFTLKELAEFTDSQLIGNPDHLITGVADLETALESDASFLGNMRYVQAMQRSKAGVVFIPPGTSTDLGRNYLVTTNPSQAFQKCLESFHGTTKELSGFTGIHPTAVIHPSCKLGQNVVVGPHAVIDKEVSIGDNTFIGSGCYIGPKVMIGHDCVLHPHVTIREECMIGNRVILQPGAVIGSCGFGYLTDAKGQHTKVNQFGNVIIEDDVEIGANATIDRARFKTTRIGHGTKLDNLVQIAHNVNIGPDNIFAAQTGIAGSSSTGRCVIVGGQVAIAGHLKLGDGVMVAGRSGISKSISAAGKYGGVPALPLNVYNRMSVHLRNIEEFVKQLQELSQRIAALEKDSP